MIKSILKKNLCFILVLASLITGVSCKSGKNTADTTTHNDSDNTPSDSVTDDGSTLATTRYEFTPGQHTSSGDLDSLLGDISDGNGLLHYEFEESNGTTVINSSLSQERKSTAMKATMVKNGGVSGSAISFNGRDEYVKLNNGFSELSQITSSTFLHPAYSALSVSVYVYPEKVSGKLMIYEQGDKSSGLAIAIIDGTLTVGIGAGSSQTSAGKITTLTYDFGQDRLQKWTNIAVSFDGNVSDGSVILYVDGTEVASKTKIGKYIPQTLDAAGLGTAQYGTNTLGLSGSCFYHGLMDDLRIYKTSLAYSGELEERAVFLQSAAAKNFYVKAGNTVTVDYMVEPSLRGFVLTYGLADRDGYSFRQTGTDNFLVNIDGALTVTSADTDALKSGATFYMEDALSYPSWGEAQKGAFRSYRANGTELYLTADDGTLVLALPDSKNPLDSVFKVTGDQTKVVSGIKGAVYYPSYALNAPQFWKWYDHEIIDRDMSYAADILGINAFRIWVSYEYWLEDPAHFEAAFKDFLDLAEKHEILIMVSLFEGCGEGYDYYSDITWNRIYTGNEACWSVTSPCAEVYNSKKRWDEPKKFLTYFISTFGDDHRLMAIETYNEPWGTRSSLAMYLTEYAVTIQKSVPLTLGTAPADPCNVIYSVEAGMDMIHYHDNFPSSTSAFENNAKNRKAQGELANLPVYCTEVQWVGGPASINYPVYSNLAPTVNKLMEDGTWAPFYWTLMVHPCYLNSYRNSYNMYNGIINEDGTVNNTANAEAINNGEITASQNTHNPYKDRVYTYRYNFFDDFFDLNAYKWTASGGSWSASSGAYTGSGLTYANDTEFEDFTATFTVSGSGGLVFRAKDESNYYYAEYDAAKAVLNIYKTVSGNTTLLATSSAINGASDPLAVTVSADSDSIRVFCNCSEASVSDSTFKSGLIGFKADAEATFDDLSVKYIR